MKQLSRTTNFFHERQLDKEKEPDFGSSNQEIGNNVLVRN